MKLKRLLYFIFGMLVGVLVGMYIVEPQPFCELYNKFLEFLLNIKELVFNK